MGPGRARTRRRQLAAVIGVAAIVTPVHVREVIVVTWASTATPFLALRGKEASVAAYGLTRADRAT